MCYFLGQDKSSLYIGIQIVLRQDKNPVFWGLGQGQLPGDASTYGLAMDSTVSYSPHSGSGRVRITFLEADPDSNVLMQKTVFL